MCEYMREMREHRYAWVCGFMREYIAAIGDCTAAEDATSGGGVTLYIMY